MTLDECRNRSAVPAMAIRAWRVERKPALAATFRTFDLQHHWLLNATVISTNDRRAERAMSIAQWQP